MSELKANNLKWEVGTSSDNGIMCVDAVDSETGQRFEICEVWGENYDKEITEQSKANAHLIAQAPAMYESLTSAPNPAQYAGKIGFETERFFADYQTWMDERRKIMSAARGES